jgi:hypothetical protein
VLQKDLQVDSVEARGWAEKSVKETNCVGTINPDKGGEGDLAEG